MMLPTELALALRNLGQHFDPEVARMTRELALPFHDRGALRDLPVLRDAIYGPDPRNRLDIYSPAMAQQGVSDLSPVILYVHGGAFVGGDKTAADGAPFYENVAAWARSRGWGCVAMTYRFAPAHGWPAGSQDVADVIAWLVAEGPAHGLDPARIVLLGQSAGAVHAATYLARPDLHKVAGGGVAAAVLLSGLYDIVAAADNPPKHAYFGRDESLYAERSSLDGLIANCRIPLLVGVCELDPADFQRQALLLINGLFARDSRLPAIAWLARHNHLSSIYLLGSSADTLAAPLGGFIADALRHPGHGA